MGSERLPPATIIICATLTDPFDAGLKTQAIAVFLTDTSIVFTTENSASFCDYKNKAPAGIFNTMFCFSIFTNNFVFCTFGGGAGLQSTGSFETNFT